MNKESKSDFKMLLFNVLLIYLIFVFYYWTPLNIFDPLNFQNINHTGYYNELAQNLKQGKLYMPSEPDPRLLQLQDPYDPAQNGGLRIHDLSLYKGKYYLYFGISPVITLYIPYQIITKHGMPNTLVIFLFSFGGFIFSVLLLRLLRKKYFKDVPEWMMLLATGVLGFGNGAGILLRRPDIYEVAISSGFFFSVGAIYFFCAAFKNEKINLKSLLFGSLFLGLAVGGRPQTILFAVLFPYIWFKIFRDFSKENLKFKITSVLASLIPFLVCLMLLGLYNYLRFENPFCFGAEYQLAAKHMNKMGIFDPRRIPANFYLNLIQPPFIDNQFPFVHIRPSLPSYIKLAPLYDFAGIVGAFPAVPFLFLLFLYPLDFWVRNYFASAKIKIHKGDFPIFEFVMILMPALLNIFVLLFMPGTIMRYLADYVTFLILAACIIWFYFSTKLYAQVGNKLIITAVSIILALQSIFFGIAFDINSPEASLSTQNNEEYKRLESLCKPVSGLIDAFNNRQFINLGPLTKQLNENFSAGLNKINIFISNITASKEYTWDEVKSKTHPIPFAISSTSVYSDDWKAEFAADGNINSTWAARGIGPLVLTLYPSQPVKIKSIWFSSRKPYATYQGWEKLEAKFFLQGKPVSVKPVNFPNAYKQRIQEAKFNSPKTDKIEIFLSDADAIKRKPDGKPSDHPIDAGFDEILIDARN